AVPSGTVASPPIFLPYRAVRLLPCRSCYFPAGPVTSPPGMLPYRRTCSRAAVRAPGQPSALLGVSACSRTAAGALGSIAARVDGWACFRTAARATGWPGVRRDRRRRAFVLPACSRAAGEAGCYAPRVLEAAGTLLMTAQLLQMLAPGDARVKAYQDKA